MSLMITEVFLPSGDEEIRTLDPLLARQVLSQLSYIPSFKVVRLISFGERPKKLNSSSLCSDSLTFLWSGTHLLSHTVSSAVPSAVQVLTVVFGMGTGVSPERIGARNFSHLARYFRA